MRADVLDATGKSHVMAQYCCYHVMIVPAYPRCRQSELAAVSSAILSKAVDAHLKSDASSPQNLSVSTDNRTASLHSSGTLNLWLLTAAKRRSALDIIVRATYQVP